jgi:hAT family C-terminal dimerisation region
MMAALREGMVLSQINPLQREIADYVDVVLTIDPDDRDTLGFWVENEIRFPILAKVARRTLCISATSCDVERLFSRAGLICTKLRSRLAPNTILCLSALHYHYSEEENISASRRSVDASARAQRFAKLTSALLVESHESYISDSDSDEDGEN